MSERSYDATTVPDVAGRAGIAPGTIYLRFASKQAMVNAAYRESKLEMHRHLPYLDSTGREVTRDVFEGIADYVRLAQKEGAVRKAPPEVLVALAFGAFVGLAKEAESGHAPLDEESIGVSESAVWDLLSH